VPEPGKDAFHRVPFIPGEVRDAVERVLTIPEDRFRGRVGEKGFSFRTASRYLLSPALSSIVPQETCWSVSRW
jgi:hypothetical protein